MKRASLLAILFVSVIAWATTVRPMSVERLTASSTHVVYARVLQHRSAWNAEHDRIFTYTQFQVMQSLKGNAPSVITVKQLGGHAGGYKMKVAGMRSWQNGEEAVLFLRAGSEPSTFSVTGLMQGDFRIARKATGEVVVSNGVPDVTELKSDGTVQQYRGAQMTMSELQQRVRRATGR